MTSVETLLYVLKDNKVLLIKKKRGLGSGLYNGVGGKVEKGETPLDAAIRECVEEVGIIPKGVEWRGVLEFYNDGKLYGYVHIFVASDYEGVPKESEEAIPIWFEIDELPYDKMWEDDKFWLPIVLIDGKKIYARFDFEDNWGKLIRREVYILNRCDLSL